MRAESVQKEELGRIVRMIAGQIEESPERQSTKSTPSQWSGGTFSQILFGCCCSYFLASIESSSTSKMSVALGPISSPAPRSP